MNALRRGMEKYLIMRRRLGFKLINNGYLLRHFASFLETNGAKRITNDLALKWAKEPQGVLPATWASRLSAVRLFAQHWSATDPRTEVPPRELLPARYRRTIPHIYTDEEVVRLIEAAQDLPPSMGLRRWTYSTLLGLLAATGLRGSEAFALDRDTVDLTNGVLTIRRTKFGKSRLVPIHSSTTDSLREYACRRQRFRRGGGCPAFFVSERGTRIRGDVVRWTFIKLSRRIGLRGPDDRSGPRIHDFRHRFAVKTLLGWYRAGLDVERHMPALSTYLGHTHVADTYWYLSAAPELLALAGARLEKTWGNLP